MPNPRESAKSRVAKMLRRRRAALGIPLREVGEATGADVTTVCKWERNKRQVPVGAIESVIRAYQIDDAAAFRRDALVALGLDSLAAAMVESAA